MIYLDNAATTKVFDSAVEAAAQAMTNGYCNPNATYRDGVSAKTAIEKSRRTIASAIGVSPDTLVFTSCATESNNWVFSRAAKPKGNIVITAGEHSSVYEPAMQLKNRGIDVRVAPLKADGAVDADRLIELVDGDTSLVSIIHVSNETGVVNPVGELVKAIRNKAPRALIHSDGVQGMLKTSISPESLGVDFYSASAHKLGAPKGIGLLYIRSGVNIAPLVFGGGQERGLRSGTQNTPYIAAFAEAVERFTELSDRQKILELRRDMAAKFNVQQGFETVGSADNSGYILCVCAPRVRAEILQNMLFEQGVIIGKGAACSGSKRGNRVLEAMGIKQADAECCFRLSFFADTKREDALAAADTIIKTASKIRSGNVVR